MLTIAPNLFFRISANSLCNFNISSLFSKNASRGIKTLVVSSVILLFRSLPLNFLYKMHKSPIFRSFFIALYKILFYNYSR